MGHNEHDIARRGPDAAGVVSSSGEGPPSSTAGLVARGASFIHRLGTIVHDTCVFVVTRYSFVPLNNTERFTCNFIGITFTSQLHVL